MLPKEPRLIPVSVLPLRELAIYWYPETTLATDLQRKRKMTVKKQVFLKRKQNKTGSQIVSLVLTDILIPNRKLF